jgi:5-(carboxyamino)imidazole ribonucleotide synthase
MNSTQFYNKKLGILGGGQLGKMLCTPSNTWHLETHILEPTVNSPAAISCKNIHQGDFKNYDDVYAFGKQMDVITIEIENVNTAALIQLQQEGKTVHPDPKALRIIQDKGLQKQFYEKHKLISSAYQLCANKQEVEALIKAGKLNFPFVQKSREAGYDGKGVAVIDDASELNLLMDVPCVIEDKVAIKKELAVIAARDEAGNINCFDVVEMLFDPKANLVTSVLCPAQVNESIAQQAKKLATDTIKAFDMVGLLAVEFFLDLNDNLIINEVAPRPHNSGHHTIENAVTSQYEQHLRAVMGLPLGSTETIIPALMVNLLGEKGYEGATEYEGLEECMKIDGAKFHIYGKTTTKPFRKMGHVTIIDKSVDSLLTKATLIQEKLRIISL